VNDFRGNDLWQRRHRENAVYPKDFPRQVVRGFSCRYLCNADPRGVKHPVTETVATRGVARRV
jgi:hypothetical protein